MKNLLLLLCIAMLFPLFLFAQPSITSFSPASGPIGTSVTITGTSFNGTPGNNVVYFGAVPAAVTASTSNSLTVLVPVGATYQPITVTTNGLTATSDKPFRVTYAGGALTTRSFQSAYSLDDVTNSETNEIVSADFDGDSKIDIALVDRLNSRVSLYKNNGAGANFSFAANIDFIAGTQPISIASGDLDGDGKLDIAVTNKNDNSVSVLRNTSTSGSIAFAPKIDFATATQPLDIALADFDNDGKIDIATANGGLQPSVVTILRNTGQPGTVNFATRTDIAVTFPGSNIATGDFNGDNKNDIAIASNSTNSLILLTNTTTSTTIQFGSQLSYSTGTTPGGLAVGDLDLDGKADIALANFFSNTVFVYRNTSIGGTTSFASPSSLAIAGADNVSIMDADGDGLAELAVQTFSPSGFSILKNVSQIGTVSFQSPIAVSAFCGDGIMAADWNGDGKMDIGVGCGALRVGIWKNKTTEPQVTSFTPTSTLAGATVTINGKNFTGTTSVKFGGVPVTSFTVVSSGIITAVVGNGASGGVSVNAPHGADTLEGYNFIPGTTINSFTPASAATGTTVTITGTNLTSVTAVSFGGVPASSFTIVNATTITAIVGSGASGNVTIVASGVPATLGGFTYIPPPTITSFTPTSGTINTQVTITGTNFTGATSVRFGGIPAGSFNVLSPTTISAIVLGGSSGKVSVITPGGSDSLAGFVFISPPPPSITSFSPLSGNAGTTITINGNNFNTDPSLNYVYFGTTQANVISSTPNILTVTVPAGAISTLISLTTNFLTAYSPKAFTVTFSGGGGISSESFSTPANFTSGNVPNDVTIFDIDGDGKNDLAIAELSSGAHISILKNTSSGSLSFAPKISFSCENTPWKIENADIDGDGKKDIIVMTQSSNSITVLKNISVPGTISFAQRQVFALPEEPRSISIGDFNKDGKPDIVIGNFNSISIIQNTSVVNNISFAPRVNFLGGFNNYAISAVDIDGDNKIDVAFVSGSRDSAYVMRNVGNLNTIDFSGATSFATRNDNSPNSGTTDIQTADIDGDGKPEMVIANDQVSKSVSVFKNISVSGNISFSNRVDYMTGGLRPNELAIEDMDGDSKVDIVFKHGYVPGTVSILKNITNAGTIAFAPNLSFTNNVNGGLAGIVCGDLDQDGKPEIISTGSNSLPSNVVYVFKNKTDGPHITSFTPGNGIAGTVITITGLNFTGASAVTFGGIPASSFTVVSSNTITAIVGSGAAGNIMVTTPLGSASVPGFLYGLSPTITSFTPTSGVSSTLINITGTNFTGATFVSFGGVQAPNFTVVSPTTITAFVSGGASGNVSVTAPGGTASLPGFTYIPPPPEISSFAPQSGATGTLIGIWGSNFTGTSTVSFGGVSASNFTVSGPNYMTAIIGNGATGSLSVTTQGGTATKTGFTYISPSPLISSFTPTVGTTGTVVTIIGSNLIGATTVLFGGVPAASFVVVNATTITAVVGNGSSGDISITTPGGTATKSGFNYSPVTAIIPVITNSTELTAKPNPGNGVILIEHPISTKTAKIKFIDILGRTAKEISAPRNTKQTQTNVNSLSQGIYQIVWSDGSSNHSRTFIVKQ